MAAELALTTFARLEAYLDLPSTLRVNAMNVIPSMISAVSFSIANLCNSDFSVRSRTLRRTLAKPVFKLDDGPARSIVSVRYSSSRMLSQGSVTLTPNGYELSPDGMTLYLDNSFSVEKFWEVVYIGGRFYSSNAAQYKAAATGTVLMEQVTFADGRKLTVLAFAGNLMTFSADAGSFRSGESFTLSNSTVVTLGDPVQESVCNDAPDLELACLMQCAYLWTRHKTLGRTSTDLGNGQTSFVKDYDLLPGVRTLLTRYSRPQTWM